LLRGDKMYWWRSAIGIDNQRSQSIGEAAPEVTGILWLINKIEITPCK